MNRLMLSVFLLAGCEFNPNRNTWYPKENPSCEAWGHVVQCATMSSWLFVPGAITVALFFPAMAYLMSKNTTFNSDKNGWFYQLLVHPLMTAIALAGLLCAGLSVGYDERITDGNYAPWFATGIIGAVLTVLTFINHPLPSPPPER